MIATKTDKILIPLIVTALLPMLFFPMPTDLSIFIEAGRIIAHGGKPYVDFIDIKPPLIYYVFALFYSIVGESEFSLRIIDFIIQLSAIFLMIKIMRKYDETKKIAYYSGLIYAMAYVSFGHNQTMQIESITSLLFVFALYLYLFRNRGKLPYLIIGFIFGFISGFKFTMSVIIITIPIYELLVREDRNKILKNSFILFIGFLTAFSISYLPLLDGSIRQGYSKVFEYIMLYASYPNLDAAFIRDILKHLAYYFGDHYSIMLTFALLTAVIYIIKQNKNDKQNELLILCFIFILTFFFSIVAEKKFFVYHFLRMMVPMIILSSVGLHRIFSDILPIRGIHTLNRIITISLLTFLFIFSPFPRWISLLRPSIYYLADSGAYEDFYERSEGDAVLRKSHRLVVDYIDYHAKKDDKVIVASVASSVLNYHLSEKVTTKFLLSCFYLSKIRIPEWDDRILKEFEQANMVIAQENEGSVLAHGHYLSSRQALITSPNLGLYFKTHFILIKNIGDFYIYKRI